MPDDELPPSGHEIAGQDIKASDAERDQIVGRLGSATAAGRLTLGEFEDRVELALTARTHGELERLVVDLPAPFPTPEPAGQAQLPQLPNRPESKKRWTLTIFSGHDRKGRWTLPRHSVYFTLFGGVSLDMTDCDLSDSDSTVTVVAIFAGAEVKIPPTIRTEMSGMALLGGKEVDHSNPPPGAPTVNFKLFPILGGISVKSSKR